MLYLHTFNIRNIYSSNESFETSSGFIAPKLDSTARTPEEWMSSGLKPQDCLRVERDGKEERFCLVWVLFLFFAPSFA